MKTTTLFAIVFILIAAFSGCKTQTTVRYIPIESVKKEYQDRLVRDSTHLYDSIYIREKGDTVWYERYKYLYRDKLIRDSIYIHDSIPVPYMVEIDKPIIINKITWWQQTSMYLGLAFVAFLIIKYKSKLFSLIVSIFKKII